MRTLVVGRRQQSESIEVALDNMELGGGLINRFDIGRCHPLLVESHNVLSRFGSLLV